VKSDNEPRAVGGAAVIEREAAQSLLKTLQRWFRSIHHHLRQQKIKLFFDIIQPVASETFLDLGGRATIAGDYERVYSFFNHPIIVNLDPPRRSDYWGVYVCGDARALPLADQSVDWVFSNAVIEHVGTWQDQMAMAKETRRVARKGYFIATPNRLFPLDPHTYLPFFHLLPRRVRWYLVQTVLYPHVKGKRSFSEYRMLSRRDLGRLFPQAAIVSSGGHSSLIAVWIAAGGGFAQAREGLPSCSADRMAEEGLGSGPDPGCSARPSKVERRPACRCSLAV
jgi:Methyltransferase domain